MAGDEGNEEMQRVKEGVGSEQLSDCCFHLLRGNVLGVGCFVLVRRKNRKPVLGPLPYKCPRR